MNTRCSMLMGSVPFSSNSLWTPLSLTLSTCKRGGQTQFIIRQRLHHTLQKKQIYQEGRRPTVFMRRRAQRELWDTDWNSLSLSSPPSPAGASRVAVSDEQTLQSCRLGKLLSLPLFLLAWVFLTSIICSYYWRECPIRASDPPLLTVIKGRSCSKLTEKQRPLLSSLEDWCRDRSRRATWAAVTHCPVQYHSGRRRLPKQVEPLINSLPLLT